MISFINLDENISTFIMVTGADIPFICLPLDTLVDSLLQHLDSAIYT